MLLEIKDLNAFYDQSHIIQNVSFEMNHGEIVCLLGRNGVGKSTALKSIIGLVRPKSGQVLFKGKNIIGLPPYAIAKLGIGFVPEDRRIFPGLTLHENLLLGSIKTGRKKEASARWTIEKVFGYFPALKDREKQKGGHLSGGEQQMLTIARTLVGNPEILLIDEPMEGLAPKIVETVEKVIQDIHRQNTPILLVEQNMRVALNLAGRFYVMSKGRVVFQGTNQQMRTADEVRQKYLEV